MYESIQTDDYLGYEGIQAAMNKAWEQENEERGAAEKEVLAETFYYHNCGELE